MPTTYSSHAWVPGPGLCRRVADMELRLEVVQIPVSDVDRAKAFYTDNLGFVLDHDVEHIPGMRVVQLTPPRLVDLHCHRNRDDQHGARAGLEGLQLVVPDMADVRGGTCFDAALPSSRSRTSADLPSRISATPTATAGVIQEIPPK